MRLILLQNNLRMKASHHYTEAIGWRRACLLRKVPLLIYAHREVEQSIVDELDVRPCFKYETGLNFLENNSLDELHRFTAVGNELSNVLSEMARNLYEDDVLIIPYASEVEIYGISLWLDSLKGRKVCRKIMFIFHTPNLSWEVNACGKLEYDDVYYQYASVRIAKYLTQGLIEILSTNDRLSQILSSIFNVQVSRCPITIDYFDLSDFTEPRVIPDNMSYDIGVMGQARTEKGNDITPYVLHDYCKLRPSDNVFVHMSSLDEAHRYRSIFSELPSNQVTGFVGEFSQYDYLQKLQNIKVLLLPYVAERYQYRVSGIFAEAVAYGIVVVIPNNTWMSDQFKKGWGCGVVFQEYTTSSILKALVTASDKAEELEVAAKKSCASWKEKESTRALLEFILQKIN